MHPIDPHSTGALADLIQAADMKSTSTLLTTLARICYQQNDLDLLNAQLVIMSKKHGQLKEAVVRMVDEAMTWLPELKTAKDEGKYKDGKDRWLELLTTLRDITEGKVGLAASCKIQESLIARIDISRAGQSSIDDLIGETSRSVICISAD